jgi:hypothetical protein
MNTLNLAVIIALTAIAVVSMLDLIIRRDARAFGSLILRAFGLVALLTSAQIIANQGLIGLGAGMAVAAFVVTFTWVPVLYAAAVVLIFLGLAYLFEAQPVIVQSAFIIGVIGFLLIEADRFIRSHIKSQMRLPQ